MAPERIARVTHEANRALQIEQADPSIPVSPPWDELDAETRESAIDGVCRAMNGHTPEQMHASWSQFKTDHGWTYGPVKDEDTKQHPCLVPYEQLPDRFKTKDMLFIAIVKALMARRDDH